MKNLFASVAVLAVLAVLAASPVLAQVRVEVNVPVPTITFRAPPPLVVVQPGVQVVEDSDDEVFFVDGFYWCRRDGRWFRTRTHNGGWAFVEERRVPRPIYGLSPGQYRHRKHEQPVVVEPRGRPHGKEHHHGKH